MAVKINKIRRRKTDESRLADANAMGNAIVDAFATGDYAEALAQVFIVTGGRHADAYSWRNRMLVALHGSTDAMGFGQWKAVGRCVRKGQKCFHIYAPRIVKDKKNADPKATKLIGFTLGNVFGIEQTDVIDEAKWAKHNAKNEKSDKFLADLPLADVAKAWGLTLQAYNGKNARGLGWYSPGQAIGVGVENLATWAHELCHAADYRNGRLKERGQHWRSETVAEFGGAILMKIMGFDTDADLGGAYEYITAYANRESITAIKACEQVLDRTCQAVAAILAEADKLSDQTDSETTQTTETVELSDDGDYAATGGGSHNQWAA